MADGHLVACSPCEHGHDLLTLAVPPNSDVWDAKCRDPKTGAMRYHRIGTEPPTPKAPK